jgi:GNAT superfamily N-acetyltransferase
VRIDTDPLFGSIAVDASGRATTDTLLIRTIASGETITCEQIMRSLPKWFGIEEAIVEYVKDIEAMETYVAELADVVAGFVTVNQRSPVCAEIHVMAVREEYHGRGVGGALVEHVEESLRARDIEYLQVKTLGPSRPNLEYERTRGFYGHLGFRALEENHLWGPVNPCLIMVKHLRCRSEG